MQILRGDTQLRQNAPVQKSALRASPAAPFSHPIYREPPSSPTQHDGRLHLVPLEPQPPRTCLNPRDPDVPHLTPQGA